MKLPTANGLNWSSPLMEHTIKYKGDRTLAKDSKKREELDIYTDGSSLGNPGKAGSGIYIRCGKTEVLQYAEGISVGTNQIAELWAIKRAMDWLKARSIRNDIRITIHTDSTYCIGCLTQGWKAKANKEIIATIKEALELYPNIFFAKVKGHSGNPGNEKADKMAVKGSTYHSEYESKYIKQADRVVFEHLIK